MTIKRIILAGFSMVLCAVLCLPVTAAGDSTDPVISQSYLESVFSGAFLNEVTGLTSAAIWDLEAETLQSVAQTLAAQNMKTAMELPCVVNGTGMLQTVARDAVTLTLGTKVTIVDGALTANGNGLIDISVGKSVADGGTLQQGHTYISANDTSGYTTTSLTGCVTYNGACAYQRSGAMNYGSMADALYELGLMKGTNNGYELNRTATRTEALVMFLRILGLEDEAKACTAANPFRDVPEWASNYAAYAYQKGLIQGIGNGLYDAERAVTLNDYLTFLLRALGYQEGSDFLWSTAAIDAAKLEMLSVQERKTMENAAFYRAQMAYLSWRALLTQQKDHQLLLCALRDDGIVTRDSIARAFYTVEAR